MIVMLANQLASNPGSQYNSIRSYEYNSRMDLPLAQVTVADVSWTSR